MGGGEWLGSSMVAIETPWPAPLLTQSVGQLKIMFKMTSCFQCQNDSIDTCILSSAPSLIAPRDQKLGLGWIQA